MSLKNMSLTSGATISVTGGTALTLVEDGVSIQNGLHLVVAEDSDFLTRRLMTIKCRQSTVDMQTGVYGKDKKSISIARPFTLANGKVVFNTIRIEREVVPYLSAADALELNKLAAQVLVDSDTTNFWAIGSLS